MKFPSSVREERNPDGFYEVENLVFTGLRDDVVNNEVEEIEFPEGAEVVKLTTVGMFRSDWKYLGKIIYCIRDPREIMVSNRGRENHPGDDLAYKHYISHMTLLFDVVKPQAWIDTICIMDYGRLLKRPEREIKHLLKFLGENTPENLALAKAPIKRKYHRSKKKDIKKDPLAHKYYMTLLKTMENQRTYWI
jgi:hypothetical protein